MKRNLIIGGYIVVAILILVSIPAVPKALIYSFEDARYALNPSAEAAYALGEKYFNQFQTDTYDIKRSREYYFEALELNPGHPTVLLQIARTSFVIEDLDNALLQIDLQINKYGEAHPSAYYVRGLIYGFKKQYERAGADFETYLKYRPSQWFAYNDLAWTYINSSQFEKALEAADTGLQIVPENAWLLISKTTALYELKRYDEAYDAATKSIPAAEKVTPEQWIVMYPGNDPATVTQGIRDMIAAANANLVKVQEKRGEQAESVE